MLISHQNYAIQYCCVGEVVAVVVVHVVVEEEYVLLTFSCHFIVSVLYSHPHGKVMHCNTYLCIPYLYMLGAFTPAVSRERNNHQNIRS